MDLVSIQRVTGLDLFVTEGAVIDLHFVDQADKRYGRTSGVSNEQKRVVGLSLGQEGTYRGKPMI